MKFSYYAKQRVSKRVTDVIMIILLIITLFPIFWMVFSSFKSNTEILLGKIPFGRASNDVLLIEQRGRSMFAFTADGGLNKFDPDTGIIASHSSIRAMAVNYLTDDVNVWASTSDKGLVQMPLDDLSKQREFSYGLKGIDINKVVSTSLCQDEKKVWVGIQQKSIEKLLQFDKETRAFEKEISFSGDLSPCQATSLYRSPNGLWVGTNKGIVIVELATGNVKKTFSCASMGMPLTDIRKMVPFGGDLLIATSSGLYQIDPVSGRPVRSFSSNNGLLSDRVDSVLVNNGKILAGTTSGLSVIDTATGSVSNYERIFDPVEGSKEKGPVFGDVFSIALAEGKALLGSSGGRISSLDQAAKKVGVTYKAADGHVMVRWRNYVDLWKNINFGLYLRNSLIICGITMFLAMIFATLAAYSLARFDFPGNKFFSIGVLATQMIPAIMYLIPIYIMFTKFTQMTGVPMKGTYVGLILIYSAFFIPFSIWILRGFFAAIPVELEEAARIDGCSPFQVFWYIVLPLAVPGIIATGVYVFLTAWDELMFAWVLCNADTMTIPVGIRLFVGNYQNRFDLMMAAATIATVPVMILFFMLQKYIVKGLTAGAVKG